MRAGASAALVVVGLLLASGVAVAAPVQGGAGPVERCAFSDRRLQAVSGLVVGSDGPRVVNDGGNPSSVFRLTRDCSVAAIRAVPTAGRDVEDMARAADGTIWLADVGDNDRVRRSVAILRLPVSGGVLSTSLAYPDGPHDAETLILPVDVRPVIVTKDLGGRSGVYTTDGPLPRTTASGSDPPTVLRRVGEVVVPPSDSPGGPAGPLGVGLLTGGALSPDGRVAALRTYTDAWLYPVAPGPGGPTAEDVVTALRAAPVRVPLAGEPQGEAVAFDVDGTLLSAGESPPGGPAGTLRAVPGAVAAVESAASTAAPAASPGPVDTAATTPATATWVALVAASTLLVLVVVVLVVATVRRRRPG